MKKILWFIGPLFCLQPTWAQQETKNVPTEPRLNTEMIRKVLTAGRKDLFNSGMSAFLHQGDMEKFWTVYADYEKERAHIDNEIIRLLRRLTDTTRRTISNV